MNNHRKILSLLLALILAFSSFSIVPFTVSAADFDRVETGSTIDEAYPDYYYEVLADGTAEISYYTGSDSEITIPSVLGGYTVTSIGFGAFDYNQSLTSVIIPDTVTTIKNYAFEDCYDLESISIPDSVTSIGYGAFANTAWYDAQPDGIVYIGKIAYKVKNATPDEVIIKDGTVSIAENLFYDQDSLTSVTIPDSVTAIDIGAFSYCTSLKSIDIPDSVTSIDAYAFYGCASLESINVPDSVTYVGYDAFGDTAWYDAQPDGIIYVGKVAYELKNASPDEAVIKDGTLVLADGLFSYQTNLKSVKLPDSLVTISEGVFSNCESLTDINIPDSVTTIAYSAIRGCSSLTSVNIPKSVQSIASGNFNSCNSLQSITVDDDNPVYDSRDNCNALISKATDTLLVGCMTTAIPDTVTTIGGGAFSGCTGLTSIDIPDTVTTIGRSAFDGCKSLESVTIGSSVEHINGMAFFNCTSLNSVTIPENVTYIDWAAFGYYSKDWEFSKNDDFTIYGFEGSEAQVYAENSELNFVPIINLADSDTGIIVTVPEDILLSAKDVTDDKLDSIAPLFDENTGIISIYDITLTQDGEEVQPDNTVTVRIPCDYEEAVVYRASADGTLTDMGAKFESGYLVFTTNHFSVYILAIPEMGGIEVSGNVTSYLNEDAEISVELSNDDGVVSWTDITGNSAQYFVTAPEPGEYTLTVSKADHVTREYTITVGDEDVTEDVEINPIGDVNGDGEITQADSLAAIRQVRLIKDITDEYQVKCADINGDGEITQTDALAILRHVRLIKSLY